MVWIGRKGWIGGRVELEEQLDWREGQIIIGVLAWKDGLDQREVWIEDWNWEGGLRRRESLKGWVWIEGKAELRKKSMIRGMVGVS